MNLNGAFGQGFFQPRGAISFAALNSQRLRSMQVGEAKEKPKSVWGVWARTKFVKSKIIVAGLLVLSACGNAGDGRYTGIVTTDQGLCGVGFDDHGKANATLLLRDGRAQFVPDNGVTVLNGQEDNAGHIHVATTGEGADHKPFNQIFEGDRHGDKVVGQLASPRCRATVELTRRS